jgi:uracil-DNA glycosylase family 4
MDDERLVLIRQVRQRLEALRRAGLDRIPRPPDLAARPRRPVAAPIAEVPAPTVVAVPAIVSPPVRPAAPAPPPALATVASLFDEPQLDAAPVPASERPAALVGLAAEVAACTKCPLLASSRTRTVFGEGSPTARLMFVGEAPGADEDRTGRPFVGRAGTLLTDMITKGMGLAREDVYIANVLKSRPPENRTPLPDEVGHCLPFLERQIAIIRPEFLCLLGKVAISALLETALPMSRLRGRWHRYRGIPTVVTWHPAYLLRNPAAKKETWDDLQMLMKAMGIKPPERKKS